MSKAKPDTPTSAPAARGAASPSAASARTGMHPAAVGFSPALLARQSGRLQRQLGNSRVNRTIQRACACGGEAGPDGECAACQAARRSPQRQAAGAAPAGIPATVNEALQSSSGQRLDPRTRERVEPAFGSDLHGVRIHTTPEAARAARDINARAFTVGQDIYFGDGQYQPGTAQGNRLLAHELTHTIQQSGGVARAPLPPGTTISEPGEPLEREAESVAERTDAGSVAGQRGTAPRHIQRQAVDEGPCAAKVQEAPVPTQPAPGGEIFTFRDRPLSRDEDFCLYTLEDLQNLGPGAAGHFVNEFKIARRQRADSLEYERKFRTQYAENPSGIAAGVPLQEDMFQTLESDVRNLTDIEPVLDSAYRRLAEANLQFMRDFDRESVQMTLCVLELSEQRANAERARYGLTEREVSNTYIQEISDRRWKKVTTKRTEYGMANNEESQKLAVAARALSIAQEKIRGLQTEQRALMRYKTKRWGRGEMLEIEYLPEENRGAFEALGKRITAAQADHEKLRASLEAEHPLLASMSDPHNFDAQRSLGSVGKGVGPEAAAAAGERVAEVLGNIKKSREALLDGDLKPWKLERIVGATKHRMKLAPGSARDMLVDAMIESRIENETAWQILKAVLLFGLALIAAIPTGGLSLAGAAVVVGAGVATVAIGAYTVVQELHEYDMKKAAHGTDFDKARAISSEDPSLIWVALSIVGLGLDLGTAAQAFKGLATTAKNVMKAGRATKEAERFVAALRTEGNAVKNGLGDSLVEDALKLRGAKEEAEQALKGGRAAEALAEGARPAVKDSMSFLHHAVCGLCFAAGTQVVTPEGRRSIETLREGDMVLARHDSDLLRVGYKRILKTYCNATNQFIEIGVAGQIIRSTPGHVWWCEGKGWLFAQNLSLGDRVATETGELADITSLITVDEVALGYNLAVEEFQTYYVAGDAHSPAVWVHNNSVVRILQPEQLFDVIVPKMVVTNPSQIRSVVGEALYPKGSYQSEVGGLLQYVRKGGGAGFQGFTKDALGSFDAFMTNLGKKGSGGVVAAVDLARIGGVPVYDLADPAVFKKVITAYPRFEEMFKRVASEGVVAVGGKVPAKAVQGLVRIPADVTEAEKKLLLTALLKACE